MPRLSTFIILSLIAASATTCNHSAYKADLILTNGKVITLDSDSNVFKAIAIKGNRILALGSNRNMKRLSGASTQIIDLKGKSVIPGLIDAHSHLNLAAFSELTQEIPISTTVKDINESIHQMTKNRPNGEWIVIPKLFSTRLKEMRWPSITELDSVAPDHPVFLDGSYAAMVNSYALEISGITEKTEHAGVLMDDTSGAPTGIIRSSAYNLLRRAPPQILTDDQKSEAIIAMMKRYNEVGITSVNIRSAKPSDWNYFQDIRRQGLSTIRTNLTFHQRDLGIGNEDLLEDIRAKIIGLGFKSGMGDEWVRVGPFKWQIDGGILTGTAFLREPWAKYYPGRVRQVHGITNMDYQGLQLITEEKLVSIITLTEALGWDFTAHCTGGAGVDLMLSAYDQVRSINPVTDRIFSIIHGNFYTPESIKKMKKLGVYADMQPAWFFKDADAMVFLLGDKRVQAFHPYKSLLDAGVLVNGGSDHMVKFDSYTSVNPYNPFLAMWTTITRVTAQGSVINPEEAISREQALKMYTINNAYLTGEEHLKGTLEQGKLADLVVISDDLLTCAVDDIKDITAVLTMVDGKVISYRDQ